MGSKSRSRKADLAKSQFLAGMSHELRTPLNAILNFTEFVSLGMLGTVNEKQVDALNKSLSSGRHGIAPASHDLIFQRFQQTETGIRHAGGTGLGLPISKYLIEAHGGTISLESEIGQGATFYIKLPIKISESLLTPSY